MTDTQAQIVIALRRSNAALTQAELGWKRVLCAKTVTRLETMATSTIGAGFIH